MAGTSSVVSFPSWVIGKWINGTGMIAWISRNGSVDVSGCKSTAPHRSGTTYLVGINHNLLPGPDGTRLAWSMIQRAVSHFVNQSNAAKRCSGVTE